MGTYVKFKLPEDRNTREIRTEFHDRYDGVLNVWDDEDKQIEMDKLASTGRGCPDYFELGQGDYKVSGMAPDDLETIELVQALATAVRDFGLVVELPTNIEDYWTPGQRARIVPDTEWNAILAKERADQRTYEKARKKAFDAAHKKHAGTICRVDTWGDKRAGVLFANVKEPKWAQVTFDSVGNEGGMFSELYRDNDGNGILLMPLRPFGGSAEADMQWLRDVCRRAFEIGVVTKPMVLCVLVYNCTPESIKLTSEKADAELAGTWARCTTRDSTVQERYTEGENGRITPITKADERTSRMYYAYSRKDKAAPSGRIVIGLDKYALALAVE